MRKKGGSFQVPRLVPDPYSEAYTGLAAGWWLLKRKHNAYFNTTADVSILYGLAGRKLLAARLCPMVLGGPYYHYADRLLAAALVWDPAAAFSCSSSWWALACSSEAIQEYCVLPLGELIMALSLQFRRRAPCFPSG